MNWTKGTATVLFPYGVERVASLLLSNLKGLDHRVIYVGSPLKGPRSTTTGWHTNTHAIQGSFFNFICLISMSFTKLKYDFCLIYPNNQMENIKVDMSDHGTRSKHLTLHWSICIMPLIIEILPKLYKSEWSAQICMRACESNGPKQSVPHLLPLHCPNQIPLYVLNCTGQNSNLENPIGQTYLFEQSNLISWLIQVSRSQTYVKQTFLGCRPPALLLNELFPQKW
jgi:hypothetical protein